ncbi:hypothetical protein [Halorubrum spindle-shaped virus-BLv25]|nr:hypothetical protein [Halorubrum spindle-shaped virus-BLv25]
MPTIVTRNGRVEVPKKLPREGDRPDMSNQILVKVSGWVKYRNNGEIHHIPPGEVLRIEESDPSESDGGYPDSLVTYQSPHGRV